MQNNEITNLKYVKKQNANTNSKIMQNTNVKHSQKSNIQKLYM